MFHNLSDYNHKTEVDIEYVETEIGSRRKAGTLIDIISQLMFLTPFQTKDAERDVKRYIDLNKYCQTGAKV